MILIVSLHSYQSHEAFILRENLLSHSEFSLFFLLFAEKSMFASTLSSGTCNATEILKFSSELFTLSIISCNGECVIVSNASSKLMLGLLPHADRHSTLIDTIPRIKLDLFILF